MRINLIFIFICILPKLTNSQISFFSDSRDNQQYEKVQIGDQVWMGQNLNFNCGTGSFYMADDSTAYSQNGRLYSWEKAAISCPLAWKLPSDNDWKSLELTLGMDSSIVNVIGLRGTVEGAMLKEGGSSSFNAKLSGLKDEYGFFHDINTAGYFWTSTEFDISDSWYRIVMDIEDGIYRGNGAGLSGFGKSAAFSVRCLKDTSNSVNPISVANSADINISISPNPSAGYYRISAYEHTINSVRVIDLFGSVVFEKYNIGSNEFPLDLAHLRSNLYFLEILVDHKFVRKKIVLHEE